MSLLGGRPIVVPSVTLAWRAGDAGIVRPPNGKVSADPAIVMTLANARGQYTSQHTGPTLPRE